MATGRVGVCMATSGPGATNLVTPIANAYMDSTPMVAITGQVPSAAIGTDAFQEADIRGITMPITKHNFLVTDPALIAQTIAEAFHIAGTGRKGPVLVDISKDALQSQTTLPAGRPPSTCPATGRSPSRTPSRSARPPALMVDARRPVLYVGGGVLAAGASADLLRLAELTGIPVVTTLMARGAFPDGHALHMGMPGMHGTVAAVGALQKSDLILALGARFDDRVTGRLDTFAPDAIIVHADIDPAEISKNRVADVPIVGDAKEVIADLIGAVRAEQEAGRVGDYAAWRDTLERMRATYPLGYTTTGRRLAGPAVRDRAARRDRRTGRDLHGRRRAAPDVGGTVRQLRAAGHAGSTPVAWAPWASRSPRPWGPRSGVRTPPSGRSTVTAASR